jgi:hypothetical protein
MILSPYPANPATHHLPGEHVTVRTDNGGELTGILVAPLSLTGVHNRLGACAADMAIESHGGWRHARISCSRITSVTVHYRTAAAVATAA